MDLGEGTSPTVAPMLRWMYSKDGQPDRRARRSAGVKDLALDILTSSMMRCVRDGNALEGRNVVDVI